MYRDVSFRSTDGLVLHARDYGLQERNGKAPLLCLAGLTRNARDFRDVAEDLSGEGRRVVCLDARGRGESAYDANPYNYNISREREDALAALDALGLEKAAVLGSSRGGLTAMSMAKRAPERLLGVALNDAGPSLNGEGLLRLGRLLKATSLPESWDGLVDMLEGWGEASFDVGRERWLLAARAMYDDVGGSPRPAFDPRLGALASAGLSTRVGGHFTMWEEFGVLADLGVPLLLLRGEGSDVLTRETAMRMERAASELDRREILGRGHIPFLDEEESRSGLEEFLERVDAV